MKNNPYRKRNKGELALGIAFVFAGVVTGYFEWFLYLGPLIDSIPTYSYPPGAGLFLLGLPVIFALVGVGAIQDYVRH